MSGAQAPAARRAPRALAAVLLAAALGGCGSLGVRDSAPVARAPAPPASAGAPAASATAPSAAAPAAKPAPRRPGSGGYYLNDGPGDNPPANLEAIPDAVPKAEPLRPANMRPYTVMGRSYTPMTRLQPYRERGIASWYGRRYHDQKTSSGEIYDMYAMTAAHTTLPIPSYARVTNLANRKSVIVRINDRGPFHSDRLIDLSYTAAFKLGVLGGGSAMVEVETILVDAGTPTVPTVAAAPSPKPPLPDATTATTATAAVVATPLPAGESLKAEPVAATPVVAVASEAGAKGSFLQLGAFGSQDNADNYLARLRAQVDWLAPVLHVYPKDGLYRVHAGPYATVADARAAAERLGQSLGIKAVVTAR